MSDFRNPSNKLSCYNCCCTHKPYQGPVCFALLSVILTLYIFLICFVPFFVGKSVYDNNRKKYPDFTFTRPSTNVLVCHWFTHIFGMLFSISLFGLYYFGYEKPMLILVGALFIGMAASYIVYCVCFFNSPEYNLKGNVVSYDQFLIFKQIIKNSKVNAIVSFTGYAKGRSGTKKKEKGEAKYCYSYPYANVFPGISSTKDESVFPQNPPREMLFRVSTSYDIGLNDSDAQSIDQYAQEGAKCLRSNWFIATGRYYEFCEFAAEKYFGIPDVYDHYYVYYNPKKKPGWLGVHSVNSAAIFGLGAYTIYMVRSVPVVNIKIVRELIKVQTEQYVCEELAVNIHCREYSLYHNDVDPKYWW